MTDDLVKRLRDGHIKIKALADALKFPFEDSYLLEAADALERLSQQQAEPVAWIDPKSIEWLRENPEHRVLTTQLRGVAIPNWMALYAAPPADEAVRLLREALYLVSDSGWDDKLRSKIDAYLARVEK
jgi:hypothetical protein